VKGKEGNSQRRPISGLALMFLYFSKNAKFLIIIGILGIAIIGLGIASRKRHQTI
jgi:hypothetical protein